MRFSPPVGGLLPREVLPGGAEVDGTFFPEGVEVGVPHYALHHNEAYYPDSFAYKPERWIVGAGEPGTGEHTTPASLALAQNAFTAFSIGPRGCLGKGMAYLEMSIVVARVLWLYEVRLVAGSTVGEGSGEGEGKEGVAEGRRMRRDEFQLVDTFVSKADGPMVEFRIR